MLVFEERGKPEYLEKNLSKQSREQTNSAHMTPSPGNEPRQALSSLRQPFFPALNRVARMPAVVNELLRLESKNSHLIHRNCIEMTHSNFNKVRSKIGFKLPPSFFID